MGLQLLVSALVTSRDLTSSDKMSYSQIQHIDADRQDHACCQCEFEDCSLFLFTIFVRFLMGHSEKPLWKCFPAIIMSKF